MPKPPIVVPLDGSAEAESILSTLDALFGPEPERILLQAVGQRPRLLSLDPARPVRGPKADSASLDKARAYLSHLLSTEGVSGQAMLVEGDPATGLLHALEETGAGIVALTHDPARRLMGSVTSAVIRKAPTPVVVVAPPVTAAGPPERIVVGIDGRPHDKVAVAIGRQLAAQHGARLELVRVIILAFESDIVEIDSPPDGTDKEADTLFQRMGRHDARKRVAEAFAELESLERDLSKKGLEVHSRVLSGPVATALAQATDEVPGSVLVVGTRPNRGLALGSVTGELLRKLRWPVVVARAGGEA